jgi:hypothetical protein
MMPARKPRPSRGWRKDTAIYDGQCDWCGWPFAEDDNGGERGWVHDGTDALACSARCARALDERRAQVEEHYRERRESEERMERGFRLAREARAAEGGAR